MAIVIVTYVQGGQAWFVMYISLYCTMVLKCCSSHVLLRKCTYSVHLFDSGFAVSVLTPHSIFVASLGRECSWFISKWPQ